MTFAAGVLALGLAAVPMAGLTEAPPAACAPGAMVGLTVGDFLSCVLPEPHEGPAGGLPGVGDGPEQFAPAPGVHYAPLYGAEPEPPQLPTECDKPMRGAWTHNQSTVHDIRHDGDRTVVEFVNITHNIAGFGAGADRPSPASSGLHPAGSRSPWPESCSKAPSTAVRAP